MGEEEFNRRCQSILPEGGGGEPPYPLKVPTYCA